MDHKKKSVTPTIWDAALTEILDAVGKYDRWLWCSWSCDVWHTPRKRTTAAVQYGYPLGKLVLLGSPRNSMLFMGIASCLLSDSVILLYDNSWLHMAQQTWALLQKFSLEMWDHLSYRPDLAPSYFHQLPIWKEYLPGHVSPALKTSDVLPTCGWRNKGICSVHLEWWNLSHALWQVSQPSRG